MSSSTSIEQQHQEFKRQISTHDAYPCFLLDQTFQKFQGKKSKQADRPFSYFNDLPEFTAVFVDVRHSLKSLI
ncbi:unnamed protein product, partial [Rotaria socialis]